MRQTTILAVVLLTAGVSAHAAMNADELNTLALKDPCAAVDVRMRQGLPAFSPPSPPPAQAAPAPTDKMVRILPVKPEPAGNPRAAPYGSPAGEYQQFVEWRGKLYTAQARLVHEARVNQYEEETHRLVLECAKRNPCLAAEIFSRRGPTVLKVTLPTEMELPSPHFLGSAHRNWAENAYRSFLPEWRKADMSNNIYRQGFSPTLAQMKKACAAAPGAGASPAPIAAPQSPAAAPQAWVDPCEDLRREVKKHKYNPSLRKKLSKCEKEHRAPVQVTPPLQITPPPAPTSPAPPTPAKPLLPPAAESAPNAPAIAQCRDQYLRLRADTLQLVHRIRASTQPFENWSRLLNSIEGRVNQAGQNLQHAGLTMAGCNAIAEHIYSQHIILTWLQAHGPRRLPNPHTIAECHAQNTRLLDKATQLIPQLRDTGRVTGYELHTLHGHQQLLAKLRQDLWRDGLSMPSCYAIGEQAARVLENLAEFAARPRTVR